MPAHSPSRAVLARLRAEAAELAQNRRRRCPQCSIAMRPWSAHPATFLCAPGRSHGWRCDRCVFHHVWVEAALSGLPPSIDGLLETRWQQAAELVEQLAELSAVSPADATTARALELLCMQTQFIAESVEALEQLAADSQANEVAVAIWQLRASSRVTGLPWRTGPTAQA